MSRWWEASRSALPPPLLPPTRHTRKTIGAAYIAWLPVVKAVTSRLFFEKKTQPIFVSSFAKQDDFSCNRLGVIKYWQQNGRRILMCGYLRTILWGQIRREEQFYNLWFQGLNSQEDHHQTWGTVTHSLIPPVNQSLSSKSSFWLTDIPPTVILNFYVSDCMKHVSVFVWLQMVLLTSGNYDSECSFW